MELYKQNKHKEEETEEGPEGETGTEHELYQETQKEAQGKAQ